MKIGLISDTHGHLPSQVRKAFSDVDLIIHAGDIGNQAVMTELQALAPVRAVYGNMDGSQVGRLDRVEFVDADGTIICVIHILNSPQAMVRELSKSGKQVDVVVFGHTHRAQETRHNGILFVNPGSATQPRGDKGPSVAVLVVENSRVIVEFVWLADLMH
jgi:uncharacterized protein